MTSTYRDNAREDVLRERYESARKTLEELAEQGDRVTFSERSEENCSLSCGRLVDALQTMGFGKRNIRTHKGIRKTVYTREIHSMNEILADTNLDKGYSGFNLYKLQPKRDVQVWCDSAGQTKRPLSPYFPLLDIVLGAGAGAISGAYAGGYLVMGAGLLAGATLALIGADCVHPFTPADIVKCIPNTPPLHKELVASGPKALRYIAGTPFEDVLKYHDSSVQVRVETPQGYVEQARQEAIAVVEADMKSAVKG